MPRNDRDNIDRRTLLKITGGVGLTGLAGCVNTTDGDGGDGGTDSDDGGDGSDGSDDSDGSGGGSRGGGGGGSDDDDGNSDDDDPATPESFSSTPTAVEPPKPAAVESVVVTDAAPDVPGTTVLLTEESPVETLNFTDGALDGTVSVATYDDPPSRLIDGATSAVGTRPADDPRVVLAGEVTLSAGEANRSGARIELTVPGDELRAPGGAVVVQKTDSGWTSLNTSSAASSGDGGSVRLEAPITAGSAFAVVDGGTVETTSPETATAAAPTTQTPGAVATETGTASAATPLDEQQGGLSLSLTPVLGGLALICAVSGLFLIWDDS